MSKLRMFVIRANGDLHEFASFGNSHLGWPLFWDWMEQQYFPPVPGKPFISLFVEAMFSPEKHILDNFWKLAYDPCVGINRRIVLRCTYDGAMLKKDDFGAAAAAFRDVAGEMKRLSYTREAFSETFTRDFPGHLPDIAGKLDEAINIDNIIGACWQGTTLSADAWGDEGIIYDHEDGETSRPFNIFKDKNYSHEQYWIDPETVDTDHLERVVIDPVEDGAGIE